MLRPATPLSILAFVAFVLLLISVLSAPIIKGIKLASYEDVDFGVFGYCKLDRCSGISVGYDPGMSSLGRNSKLREARGDDRTLSL